MEMALETVCTSCGNVRLPDGRFCLFCGDLLSDSTAKNSELLQGNPPLDGTARALTSSDYAGFLAQSVGWHN